MPNQDKTGPQGQGPVKGRGMGRCGRDSQERDGTETSTPLPDSIDRGQGQGRGLRRGQGANDGRCRGGRGGRGGGGRDKR
ncbi:DUF5320 domain-containing protein [Desulfopila sp. IMCC35008]|uniref:DUF5320 domain-containing protein n=1 Tax=Desulfopila sp. IMCC35008 TaxID=2653858 RepID=UPI0013CFECCB|nr:DUF5320 domain-containing protein [Desulfopila sp. IMCC35008]